MVICDECDRWVHIACDGISEELYQELNAHEDDDHPYCMTYFIEYCIRIPEVVFVHLVCPKCRKVDEPKAHDTRTANASSKAFDGVSSFKFHLSSF